MLDIKAIFNEETEDEWIYTDKYSPDYVDSLEGLERAFEGILYFLEMGLDDNSKTVNLTVNYKGAFTCRSYDLSKHSMKEAFDYSLYFFKKMYGEVN